MNLNLKKSWYFLTVMLVTLNACSTIPLPPPQPLVIKPSQLEVLMRYYDHIRKMPVTELIKEHNKVKQNLELTQSDAARAELALLLVLPDTSFRDTSAALDLLDKFPKDAKLSVSMLSFKHLLSALLAEQQLINENVKELSQKLKNMDEQTQKLKNVKELSQKLKEEQKHSEVLEKKIDDIKSMEKSLILRDKP
ncbi:dihydrolipoamide acyltransferase [Candidatus Nitrotoga sp. M5]|uniref:dihydrolipoamide acyltransferase n=1 Tax=Candidatus Nitrotoga sp. M5 TaxID=2890409 RepID=UPI001EF1AA4B|nr:dihydrolipoamide acyltransferase [Candidatus Nitrotoga sp. M5]CAH1386262.1 conserved exported hypothetical protein [Candidatus Nitrotoga sp. M5]